MQCNVQCNVQCVVFVECNVTVGVLGGHIFISVQYGIPAVVCNNDDENEDDGDDDTNGPYSLFLSISFRQTNTL